MFLAPKPVEFNGVGECETRVARDVNIVGPAMLA
jgi:hypothetical protein